MTDKKGKASDPNKNVKPSAGNDQLGENSGEGRFEKASAKKGKCR